jgi:hypothetical protein
MPASILTIKINYKEMKYLQFLSILIVVSILSSCATILTGTTQRITIDSTPPGAKIVIDGRLMGTTPAKVRLDRDVNAFINDGKDIFLEKEGFYSDGYYLGTDIEPVCILNVFMPPGFAIDAVTGALMRYDSEYYNFRLMPIEDSPMKPNASQYQGQTSSPSASNTNTSDEDDYEKLMKLVDLYEDGLITEEEFEAQKAKILEENR